jgi:hypothetical protein
MKGTLLKYLGKIGQRLQILVLKLVPKMMLKIRHQYEIFSPFL